MNKLALSIAIAACAIVVSCDKQDKVEDNQATANPHADLAIAQSAASVHSGIVEETMSIAGYTYARINIGAEDMWLAGPQTKIENGEKIYWKEGAMMSNFTSKSLSKTFDSIWFIDAYLNESQFSQGTAPSSGNSGSVKSVLHAAGYVYLEVANEASGSIWVAAPDTEIAEHDNVQWGDASVMTNFHSNSLDRTFDEILFASSVAKIN